MILEGYTIAADLIAALVGAEDLFPYRVLHPTPYLAIKPSSPYDQNTHDIVLRHQCKSTGTTSLMASE